MRVFLGSIRVFLGSIRVFWDSAVLGLKKMKEDKATVVTSINKDLGRILTRYRTSLRAHKNFNDRLCLSMILLPQQL